MDIAVIVVFLESFGFGAGDGPKTDIAAVEILAAEQAVKAHLVALIPVAFDGVDTLIFTGIALASIDYGVVIEERIGILRQGFVAQHRGGDGIDQVFRNNVA